MPRQKVTHLNSPEDDEHTVCGKKLAKVNWTLEPVQVTCKACWKIISKDEEMP